MAEPNYTLKVSRAEINEVSAALQLAHQVIVGEVTLITVPQADVHEAWQKLSDDKRAERYERIGVQENLLRRIG